MFIHSAYHLTYLGRTLKINKPSDFPDKSTILILTKPVQTAFNIKERTRICSEKTAKSMRIRKFLKFSEHTFLKVGSFEIKMAEMSQDKSKFNFFVNDSVYFMTFVPENFFPFPENTTLLIPADSEYFAVEDFLKVDDFIAKTRPCRTVFSGSYSEKWFSMLKDRQNADVRNEIAQQTIFA